MGGDQDGVGRIFKSDLWHPGCFINLTVVLISGIGAYHRPHFSILKNTSVSWKTHTSEKQKVYKSLLFNHWKFYFLVQTIRTKKHRKNCKCCPVSQLIVRWQILSGIQVLNCQNCYQCLKCHKSQFCPCHCLCCCCQ